MRRPLLLAVLSAALGAPLSGSGLAQGVPTEGLTQYGAYRGVLQRNGWQPDTSFGDGMNAYREVMCGNRICTARWIHGRTGRAISLTLWRSYQGSREILHVSPQQSDDD